MNSKADKSRAGNLRRNFSSINQDNEMKYVSVAMPSVCVAFFLGFSFHSVLRSIFFAFNFGGEKLIAVTAVSRSMAAFNGEEATE